MIYIKIVFKYIWKLIVYFQILFIKHNNVYKNNQLRIFYGGGFPGNKGGPRVKIKRLQLYFKNYNVNFNLLYLLSNSHYLLEKSFYKIKSKNIPIVLNQNGVYYSGWYSGNWKKMNKDMSSAYHNSDYVFWQSQFCKKSADKFLGLRKGKGEILYNAVDTNIFFPLKNKSAESILKLLLTGRITGQNLYRIENVIKSAILLKRENLNFKIDFYGLIDNKNYKKIKKLIDNFNLRGVVNLCGSYSQKNAPEIYRNYDIYLIMNYMDPCPNTVIEAMSSGLPIIFSATGGLKELVGRKAGIGLKVEEGWNFKPFSPNPDKIAEAIIIVKSKLTLMGEASRKRAVEKFDINIWISRHQHIFKMMLERVS